MLSAHHRMRRSAEFGTTVKRGVRTVQPDIVVHARRDDCADGPRIGLVVSKAVGGAVVRHRVARQLRHVARRLVPELDPAGRVVIRALPSSSHALTRRLEQQLRTGLARADLIVGPTP